MSKPEPLKDKKLLLQEGVSFSKNVDCFLYDEIHIKSAVEWLRNNIEDVDYTQSKEDTIHTIKCLINQAFADVIK